ncbi:MAG: MFS transporter [Clostridia bacterium]|nr:MFS transporter [Clostridia bacterium]
MGTNKMTFGDRVKKAIGIEGSTKEVVGPMLSYNATNIATSGAGYFFSLYYIPFLVYVEGLSAAQVGLIILIKSIWDAITDPIMGVITDRTHSRFGKHRVYIMFSAVPFSIAYFMTWYSFGLSNSMNSQAVMWYYIAAYLFYSTMTTVLLVPHTAMLPELAPEYFLRTQYNSVGYLMNSAGMVPTFILATIVLNFVRPERWSVGSFFGSVAGAFTHSLDPETIPKSSYFAVGLTLAIAYLVPIFITAAKCKEPSSLRTQFAPFDGGYVFREYKQVFRNKAFRQYFTISILYAFALGFYNNSKIFLLRELTDTYQLYGLINIIAGVFEASGFPLNYAITKKYGKQKCSWITTPFYLAALAIALFLTTPKTPGARTVTIVLVMIHTVLYNFGLSGIGFTNNNNYPDVTDVDELITGRRREGVIATFSSFIKKVAHGVMGMFVLTGLEWFGVSTSGRKNATQMAGAIPEGKHAYELFGSAFNSEFGIKLFSAAIPIVCIVFCLIALRKFTMTKADHTMIRAAIAVKKKYGAVLLTDEQIRTCEQIAGQKWANMWISQQAEGATPVPLETDETGAYLILKEKTETVKEEATV